MNIIERNGCFKFRSNNSPVYLFHKVLINKPQGGFYLLPEFLNHRFKSSSEMCEDILKKTGVALLPGSDFGFDQSRMLVRLSYTDFDGKNFMSNINLDTKVDEDLIEKFAPKIREGTKRIKDWVEKG